MPTTEDHSGPARNATHSVAGGDRRVYEVGYLILPSIPEESVSNVVDSIKQVIKEAGATELDGEMPHKRPLAYQMSKTVGASKYVAHEAYIGWLKFESESSGVKGIETKLKELPEVLRFLVIKAPKETTFTFAQAMEKDLEVTEPEKDPVSDVPTEPLPEATEEVN